MDNELTTQANKDLSWLLESFVQQVPGVESALLATRDGLKMPALAGLTGDQADHLSAIVSGMYSLAGGIASLKEEPKGGVRQILVEHGAMNLFVTSAGDGLPPGVQVDSLGGTGGKTGTILGVLAEPDADLGNIGYAMAALVTSVAEHLEIPIRRTTDPGDGQ